MGLFESITQIFGGGGNNNPPAAKQIITNRVTNNINVQVTNNTQNITDTINSTINSVTTEMINSNESKTDASVSSSNILKSSQPIVIMGSGNKVNLNQKGNAAAQVTSAQQISTSNKMLQDLVTNIQSQIENKVNNKSDLKTTVTQTAALNNLKSDDKGIGDIVTGVMDSLTSLFASKNPPRTDEDIDSIINSNISTSISNSTLNSTSVTNALENHFQAIIKNLTNFECKINVQASNLIDIAGIIAGLHGGSDNSINIDQFADATGLVSCMQSTMNVTELVNAMTFKNNLSAGSLTTSDNKTDTSSTQKSTTDNTKKTSDNTIKDAGKAVADAAEGIGESIKSVEEGAADIIEKAGDAAEKNNPFAIISKYIGVIIGLCCLCCVGGFIFTQIQSSNNNEKYDEEYDEEYDDEYDEEYYEEYNEYQNQYGGSNFINSQNISNNIFKFLSFFDINSLLLLFILILFIIYIF